MLAGSLSVADAAAAAAAQSKYVTVLLLTQQTVTFAIQSKAKVGEVYEYVCSYVHSSGVAQSELFGLTTICDGEYIFLDAETKISKYAPRQWKAAGNGLDCSGQSLLQLQLRVRHYVETPLLIRDQLAQFHYYLQLRENVLRYGFLLAEDPLFLLASYALQADLGNYNEGSHKALYFEPADYFPQWMIDKYESNHLVERVATLHRNAFGLSPTEAQFAFSSQASQSPWAHNLHLYRLRRKKNDPFHPVTMVVCQKGISIYQEEETDFPSCRRSLVSTFEWAQIEDLSFDKKKFEIRATTCQGKMTFYTSSDQKSKHLLQLCRSTHQESQTQRPRLAEMRRIQVSERHLQLDRVNRGTTDQSHSLFDGRNENVPSSSSYSPPPQVSDGLFQQPCGLSLQQDLLPSSESKDNESMCPLYMSLTPSLNHEHDKEVQDQDKYVGFGRSPSMNSSSSQHSASTVRSHYSHSSPLHPPELTLGAELADLAPAPDLPELADLPNMDGDISVGCHHSGDVSNIQNTHNCCSTCYNDDDDDDDDVSDEENVVSEEARECYDCGTCQSCVLKNSMALLSLKDDAVLKEYNYPSNREFSPLYKQSSFISDSTSVIVQPDFDDMAGPSSSFPEEDFLHLDNNETYVEFFKDERHFREQYTGESESPERSHAEQDSLLKRDSALCSSKATAVPGSGLNLCPKGSEGLDGFSEDRTSVTENSPEVEVDNLDYSVESAQASLNAEYSMFPMWRLRANVQDISQRTEPQLSAVTMSTVKTVTSVSVASSCMRSPQNAVESKNQLPSYVSKDQSRQPVVKSSEAPAKFITSRPQITVLKAQTHVTSTASPSYTSEPLSKGHVNTFPLISPKPKIDPIQSLQRCNGQLPDPKPLSLLAPRQPVKGHYNQINRFNKAIPIIRKNNYLDFRASSCMNKCNMKSAHPRQAPYVTPRTLYLKHKRKDFQHEQQQLLQMQRLQKQFYGNSALQVPVPHPSPSSKLGLKSRAQQFHSFSSHVVYPEESGNQSHCQTEALVGPGGNTLHPNVNFFQNPPPPPSPHISCGMSACPTLVTYNRPADFTNCIRPTGSVGYSQDQVHKYNTPYSNQISQSQLEQYKAQLYSDVDYVIYPPKDPALSRQEYMDAKQGQVIATQAIQYQQPYIELSSSGMNPQSPPPPPPYRNTKLSLMFRSTPNVAGSMANTEILSSYPSYQSLASTQQPGSSSGYSSMARGRYYSQQSLASSSVCSFPSGYSASTQSLSGSYDQAGETVITISPSVARVRSDESILSCSGNAERESHKITRPDGNIPFPSFRPKETLHEITKSTSEHRLGSSFHSGITLQELRERGGKLDVPLLTALCSDASLVPSPALSKPKVFSKASTGSANRHYSMTGVYTTNQISSKGNSCNSGIHQHPHLATRLKTGQKRGETLQYTHSVK